MVSQRHPPLLFLWQTAKKRTVRYEVTFVKRENVIVKTKQSLS